MTIHWWLVGIALFVAPIIYSMFRERPGDWDRVLDVFVAFALSWGMAAGIVIGHFF